VAVALTDCLQMADSVDRKPYRVVDCRCQGRTWPRSSTAGARCRAATASALTG